MPPDLRDLEPTQLIDPSNRSEELFEVVPLGLYPKYLYRLDIPEIGRQDLIFASVRFTDPVKAGRCVLLRANLLAQRFERWEIESGVMIFGPGLRKEMKLLVNRAKNLSRQAKTALSAVPLHLRRHEPFKCGKDLHHKMVAAPFKRINLTALQSRNICLVKIKCLPCFIISGSCFFDDIVCNHLTMERENVRKKCLENFEKLAQEMDNVELGTLKLVLRHIKYLGSGLPVWH